jgi:hypothetical protein
VVDDVRTIHLDFVDLPGYALFVIVDVSRRSVMSPLGSEVLGVRRSTKRFWSRLMVGQAMPGVLKVSHGG